MQKEKYILFRLEGCPYCRKAEEYMDRKGIKYRKIEVPPSREDRKTVMELSGQPTVPVLVQVIGSENQDDDIVEYFEKK